VIPVDIERQRCKAPRVLVAENDAAMRHFLEESLIQWGYEAISCEDGTEAWKILEGERPPELVIMGWQIPGIDSFDLCRRLRSKTREFYHYILVITADSDKRAVMQALEAGADDCLARPFDEAELRARLIVSSRILALQEELIRSREEQREQAMKDSLTGLWNRAAFLDLFTTEMSRAERSQSLTGLLMLDLDHFKQINDAYGHLAGDIVLKETARRLKQNVRAYDFVGRYGGEEFLIALPGCERRDVRMRAEAIRVAMCTEPVRIGNSEITVSISIGGAVASVGQRSILDVLAIADVALYKAKNAGRNRVVYCERSAAEILQSAEGHHTCCSMCDPGKLDTCVVSGLHVNPLNGIALGFAQTGTQASWDATGTVPRPLPNHLRLPS